MRKVITTNSFEETQKLGLDFADKADDIQVLALHGDLGFGKTTFVQGLAKGLGITKNIISPTFILMRTYKIDGSGRKKFLYHIDLYRIEDEKDIEALGLIELMEDTQNLIVIEWPNKLEDLLPEDRTDIFFEYLGDDKRKIAFND